VKLENFTHFVANLSKKLRINFYQNRSSIVEVMIKKILCVFYASQCILLIADNFDKKLSNFFTNNSEGRFKLKYA